MKIQKDRVRIDKKKLCFEKERERMKGLASKTFAIIGLSVNALLFIVGVVFIILMLPPEPSVSQGVGFFLMGLLVLLEIVAYFFYFIDAIFSVVKIFKKIDPVFNTVLSLSILGLFLGWGVFFIPDINTISGVFSAILFLFLHISLVLSWVVPVLEIISVVQTAKKRA